MRTIIPQQSQVAQNKTSRYQTSRELLPASVQIPFAVLAASAALFAAQLFLGATLLTAQAPAANPAATPASTPVHKALPPHTRPSAAHRLTPLAPAAPAPVMPPAPELPHWPANDRPVLASVVWDSQGLRIDAANSSLQQILKDISTATGVTVDGMAADERVFGAYGPGQARDVLSQLLEGSGYNVIMIGDQGQGAPRQIVLSDRHAGDAQPAAKSNPASSNDDDADADEPPQPQPSGPAAFRPGFPPGGGPPRTPPQINMQEQQQQQRQQQTQPPNNPPY